MKPLTNLKPTLIISPLVKKKMELLVSKSDKEIAWHGFVKKIDKNTYHWYDIIMYPQYNTAATSTSEDEEYAQWLIRQMEFDNFDDMRLHGHSHVNMAVSPSGTDMAFRQNILANTKDYYIFMIVNKPGDYSIEIYDYESNICFEKVDIKITVGTPDEIQKADYWAENAIKNNVRERNKQCSTISNLKNSSILENLKDKFTSSDAEPWEDPLAKYLLVQE